LGKQTPIGLDGPISKTFFMAIPPPCPTLAGGEAGAFGTTYLG